MNFTHADRDSATWQKLKEHYEGRLNLLREQNDSTMSEEKRNQLVGRIHEVKALLQLEKPKIDMKE